MKVSLSSNIDPNKDANLKIWLSDQEIFFNKLRANDITTFKMLYQQYASAIYGSIIRRVGDEEKAKLILEQTFCEVWQSLSEYNKIKVNIFTWINQIASQKANKIAL